MSTVLLIAEPDGELREIYGRLSRLLGCTIETAADGPECWNSIRAAAPAAAVIDIEILLEDGGEFARLREAGDGARSPVVIVTGDDSPGRLSSRTGIPAERCFQKPFRLSALLESVLPAVGAARRY